MGLDYVTVIPLVPLVRTRAQLADTGLGRERALRSWQDEHRGLITNRDDFSAYRWPSLDQISLLPVDYTATKMPDGMKVMLMYIGIFEDLRQLMGFETLAYATADDPELVDEVLERLTRVSEYTVGLAAAHPATGAIFYADDMGFSSGPFLSPRFMRTHVMPRLKRIADACHAHGKPFILHSCGNVLPLMDAMRRGGVEFVLTAHEGSAGFAADVSARMTGRPGLAIATLGPGATNLATGVFHGAAS